MRIKELLESEYHNDVMIELRRLTKAVSDEFKLFDYVSNAKGFTVASNNAKELIDHIEQNKWSIQWLITTPKLKLAYQNLQNEIQKLTDKIDSGV